MTALQPEASGTQARRLFGGLIRAQTLRVLAVRSLGVAALFAFEIIMARSLGVAGYGAFSFALAIAAMASRIAPLGWLNASTRLVSDYTSSARFGLLKGSLIIAYAETGLGLLLTALLLALLGLSARLETPVPILPYVLPLAIGLAILELHRYILRGLRAGDLGEALLILLLPGLAAAAAWSFGLREASAATFVYGAVCILLVLFSAVLITQRLPAPMWATRAEFRTREWSLAALAMLLGGTSDELTARAAVIVLGTITDEHQIGLYQAAARLALMNVFVLRALTPVAAPEISVLYASGRFAELRSTFLRLCLMSLAGALPFFLLFALFPRFVLAWFGPDFVDAAAILRVLSLGYLASAAGGPCATALMMIGRERIYGRLAFATFLLNTAGAYVLANYLGGLGAAIATASVMALNNTLYLAIFLYATAPARTPKYSSPHT